MDDLEAGELSVEFEGREPWELLEWALDRFGDGLALSTAFQEGDVALIDMAYSIDPSVRVFSIDTGRLPQETFDLIEQLRERYQGLRLELLSPQAEQVQRLVDRNGPNLFRQSVELRLLCCNVRKVQPLNRALAGLDAWVTGLRRDQWASRSDIRKIEIDHDHDAIVKLNPLAEWTEGEVWDYLRENDVPVASALRARLHVDRLRPVHPCDRARRADAGRPLVVGVRRAEGVRDALRDRDGRLRARAPRDPRRGGARMTALALRGEEREVALAEVDAVRAVAQAGDYRERLDALRESIEDEGTVDPESIAELERLVTIALQSGRVRAVYGPGGEQALLRLYRKLPGGVELAQSAAAVGQALSGLQGRTLESVSLTAVGPGAFSLTVAAGGVQLKVHLDRQGARLASVEA